MPQVRVNCQRCLFLSDVQCPTCSTTCQLAENVQLWAWIFSCCGCRYFRESLVYEIMCVSQRPDLTSRLLLELELELGLSSYLGVQLSCP